MAKNNGEKKYDIFMPFQRTSNFPLDRSSVFSSYNDALKYAEGAGDDEKKLGKTSYLGQVIAVVDVNLRSVQIYKVVFNPLNPNQKSLSLIGEGGGSGGSGTLDYPIYLDEETILPAGTPLTDAIAAIVTYFNRKIEEKGDGKVQDVQINGTTILDAEGIANFIFSNIGDVSATVTGNTIVLNVTKITNDEIVIE